MALFSRFNRSRVDFPVERKDSSVEAKNLNDRAAQVAASGDSQGALKIFDEVITRFGATQEPDTRTQVARAMGNKGVMLGLLGQTDEAIRSYDLTLERFGSDQHVSTRTQVIGAISNKGSELRKAERYQEVSQACDEMKKFLGANMPEESLPRVALLFGVGVQCLAQIRDFEGAVKLGDETLAYFRAFCQLPSDASKTESQLAVRLDLCKVQACKSFAMWNLGDNEGAAKVFEEAAKQFSGDSDQAKALLGEIAQIQIQEAEQNIVDLQEIDGILAVADHDRKQKPLQAIALYDRIVQQFGAATNLEIQAKVARALIGKGYALQMGLIKFKEAISTFEDVDRRYGKSKYEDLRWSVVSALLAKGNVLVILDESGKPLGSQGAKPRGQEEKAILVFDEVVQRFSGDKEPKIRAFVARAIYLKALSFERMRMFDKGASEDPRSRQTLQALIQKYKKDREGKVKEVVQDAEKLLKSIEQKK